MKIINNINNIVLDDNTVIALGNFDGIHKGHKELIVQVNKMSKQINAKSAILLFNEHTKDILYPNETMAKLTTLEDKLEILENFKLDYVFIIDFKAIYKLSPEKFIAFLVEKFNCKGIVVGNDYRFGNKAIGDINILKKLSIQYDITLNIVNTVKSKETSVKSTIIRRYISNGNILKANLLLGRKYFIKGTVIHGEKRGRILGFPTVNILNEYNYVLPKEGVYYSNITILDDCDNKVYSSLSFIGNNLTFNEYDKKIETYIFNFSKYIYGKKIKIEFIDYIRGNKKFNSSEELIDQMNNDVEYVKKYNNNLLF